MFSASAGRIVEPHVTYDYECKTCGYCFEAEQKITEAPLKKCVRESCGGDVKRLIHASGFVLKGTGWYRDGYGK